MNELKTFNFDAHDVRTLTIDDEPYFVGKDVAEVLGYKNGSRDINRHVDKEDMLTYRIGTSGQKRYQTIINESGLYALIFGSKLDSAKQFKRWVTSEVLPSIRKTGTYMINPIVQELQNNPEIIQLIADRIEAIRNENEQTNTKLDEIDKKIEGEYVTPQDLYAIDFAIKVKAELFVEKLGIQMTLDNYLTSDIYEQAKANKLEKQQRRNEIGRVKRAILVIVKKHLGMKGNQPNNHIKRKDVDVAVQYIKNIKISEVV